MSRLLRGRLQFRVAGPSLGAAIRPIALPTALLQQLRPFSASSPWRQLQVISFSPTSSPELDAILEQTRKNLVLPGYLRADERKRLTKKKHERTLKNDPVTLEIDGVVEKFYYTNPQTDMPSTKKLVRAAVANMKEPRDWANLPRLLEGVYSVAGRKKWNAPHDFPVIARKAGSCGQIYTVVQCARMVRKTGFRLYEAEVVGELLYWIQLRAFVRGWADGDETRRSLRWADQVVDLLSDPEHVPLPSNFPSGAVPVHLSRWLVNGRLADDPKWVGAQLHLAAALVVKHGDESMLGRVEELADALVDLWPRADAGLLEIHPEAARSDKQFMGHPTGYLRQAAPLMSGLDMAKQAVSASRPELAAALKKRYNAVAAEVDEMLRDTTESSAPGRRTYDLLFGTSYGPTQGKIIDAEEATVSTMKKRKAARSTDVAEEECGEAENGAEAEAEGQVEGKAEQQ